MSGTELRIGNLIYWDIPQKKGVVHVVKAILPNTLHTIPISLGKHTKNEYKPIPLTEDWLLKFGFEKLPHSFSLDRIHITKQDDTDYWFTAFNKNNAHINKLKYVHQLQNLYHALTGLELKVKL